MLNSKTLTETLEQHKSNSWTPMGPTKDRASSPNQLYWKLFLGRSLYSAGVQLKRAAMLLTVIALTKNAVCRIIFLLYLVLFYRMIIFSKLIRKVFPPNKFSKFIHYSSVTIKFRFRKALFKKRFESNIFGYQVTVTSIEFWKSFTQPCSRL